MRRGLARGGAMVMVSGVSLLLALGGCKSGPCSGLGMMRDDRALPKPWDTLGPPPAGAVGCMPEEKEMQVEWSRSYELGDSPKAGFTAFYDQLKSKGWVPQMEKKSTERFEAWFEHSGHSLRLFASSHVQDMGWITVEFKLAEPAAAVASD